MIPPRPDHPVYAKCPLTTAHPWTVLGRQNEVVGVNQLDDRWGVGVDDDLPQWIIESRWKAWIDG